MSRADPSARVLALCSATRTASIALLRSGEVVQELWAAPRRHHAESLLPLLDEILRRGDCALDDLTGYALCVGPGSFTSLRVGLATVKGLAFGSDLQVAPVSALRSLAAATLGDGDRPVIGMLDAMRDEVYAAAYTGRAGGWAPLPQILPERVYTAEELAERIPADSLLMGEGAAVVCDRLRQLLGERIEIAHPAAVPEAGSDPGARDAPGEARGLVGSPRPMEPSAAVVGRLGQRMLEAGEGVLADSLAPHYVRRAEAEVLRTNQRFEVPA